MWKFRIEDRYQRRIFKWHSDGDCALTAAIFLFDHFSNVERVSHQEGKISLDAISIVVSMALVASSERSRKLFRL